MDENRAGENAAKSKFFLQGNFQFYFTDKSRHKVKLFLFYNTFYDTCTYIIEKRGRPVGSARRRSESPTEDFRGILNFLMIFRT